MGGEMEHNFGKKIAEFLEQKKWKKMKRGDWLILVLAGVLLLVIAMPVQKEEEKAETQTGETLDAASEKKTTEPDYAKELEERLENVLEQMEGVGKVKVMITLSDFGEDVLEKDCVSTGSTTTETDSNGGNRTITESEISNATVYVETDGEKSPYLKKELTPAIEGIVVVAEGGDDPVVISDISDAAMALFPVEAHKVKVVKMSMQEDSK